MTSDRHIWSSSGSPAGRTCEASSRRGSRRSPEAPRRLAPPAAQAPRGARPCRSRGRCRGTSTSARGGSGSTGPACPIGDDDPCQRGHARGRHRLARRARAEPPATLDPRPRRPLARERIHRRQACSAHRLDQRRPRARVRGLARSVGCGEGRDVRGEPLADVFGVDAEVRELVAVRAVRTRLVARRPSRRRPGAIPRRAPGRCARSWSRSRRRVGCSAANGTSAKRSSPTRATERHRPIDRDCPALDHLGAELERVVAVAAPATRVVHEAAHRAEHAGRGRDGSTGIVRSGTPRRARPTRTCGPAS